ncbi:acyl-CoA thioesterase [Anaerosalibacter massiliensis]|uniref:Acyl-CoA thioesterase n=1 Tax=Anaerosalibacter massiliensis TaxID=1347392 RepID=A0A9X2MIV7_9FIRM|nr:thioesterase family protein [Anaerosalibacter massiliensis]MCR2043977.1 acyl-CoA thioesterase [Anaerosalibacter massiliensis]
MIQETTIRARYKETDQMGVVYYGNYFTWFEVGRNEFFRELGLACSELENEEVLLPVIETGCKYINSAKFDDEVIIKTKLTKLKGVRLELRYEIYRKSNNELLVEGFTKHAFVDKELKPVRFRRKFKKEWSILQNSLEKGE